MDDSRLTKFAFTWGLWNDGPTEDEFSTLWDRLEEWSRTNAKHYIFQLERGEGGLLHYQGYINLKKQTRFKGLIKMMQDNFHGIHLSICSKAGEFALKQYCMKTDTRVSGPWMDKVNTKIDLEEKAKEKFKNIELRPWQQEWFDLVSQDPDDRCICWLTDEKGGAGKTKLAKWAYAVKGIPTFTYANSANVLNLVSKMPHLKTYCFDLARTKSSKIADNELYTCLESIKNGYFVNEKYETNIVFMESPHVWVFANQKPKLDRMSGDRWRLYEIRDGHLVQSDGLGADAVTLPSAGPSLRSEPPTDHKQLEE